MLGNPKRRKYKVILHMRVMREMPEHVKSVLRECDFMICSYVNLQIYLSFKDIFYL